MKPLIAFSVGIALLLCAEAAMSQDTSPPPAPQKKAAARPKGVIAQMDEQTKKMQAVHEKMIGATTAEERQKASEEARKEMQAAMAIMQPAGRGAGGAEGSIAAEADAEVAASGFKGGRRQAHTEALMMTKRMDLMQMIVQLMMDQQAMMMSPAKGGGATPKKK